MKQHVTPAVTTHQSTLTFPVETNWIHSAEQAVKFRQGSAGALFLGQKTAQKIKIHADQLDSFVSFTWHVHTNNAPLITCVHVKSDTKRFGRFKDMNGSFPFDGRFRPNRLAFKQREESEHTPLNASNNLTQRVPKYIHNGQHTEAYLDQRQVCIVSGERPLFYNFLFWSFFAKWHGLSKIT